ncbi:MAG: GNAT family N-acetyltransferase [Chitinophagales bacterium]|nr:GNAT family N-acetyltransferase [Chitinophagales bacterium]
MRIREAKEDDLIKIEYMMQIVWETTFRHFVPQKQIKIMQAEMHHVVAYQEQIGQGHHFLVAEESNKILGFVTYYEIDKGLKISKLYIDSQSQSSGIGRKLIRKVICLAQEKDLGFIELNVNRYNKALYFYRKLGFYIKESQDIPYHEYFLYDYLMRYDISSQEKYSLL